jgi:hypothetical protein
VKYGVMNITNDPAGVQCCYGYGDSYLVLQNVRLRATFASQDSASEGAQMATWYEVRNGLVSDCTPTHFFARLC